MENGFVGKGSRIRIEMKKIPTDLRNEQNDQAIFWT